MWDKCGMSRNANGLKQAIKEIKGLREDFHKNVIVPGGLDEFNEELVHKFHSPGRVAFYSISFVFLSLHLMHGFVSSFKSVGVNNKYSNTIKIMAIAFSVIVPLGFIFIAIFHHLNG